MRSLIVRFSLAALLLVTSLLPYQPAISAPPDPSAGLLQSLTNQAGSALRIGYHPGTGKVNFLGASAAQPLHRAAATDAALSAEAGARQFLGTYGSLFGLTGAAQELSVKRDKVADGRSYVRFQQQYGGVPVIGGELIVQLDAARSVVSASGEILPDISVSTLPALDAASAQQIALAATAGWHGVAAAELNASAPELWVYNPVLLRADNPGATRLVWRLEVKPNALSDIRELVLVDAHNGKIALHFNQIHTALNRVTYDAENGEILPGPTLECTEAAPNCTGGVDTHADGAHIHAGQTYTFYLTTHGRDSIDGAGLTLTSTVHFSTNYFNAFWEGTQMVYGDDDGFPLADDVVAHELTHGVTQYESNLFYYYQSGAINESFSDVWGEFLDLTNGTGDDSPSARWLMGEDITVFGALRDMQDPPAFNDPDKMTSPNYNEGSDDAGDNDLGGVHSNSGVNNKAAYLMTDGDTFNGITVTGLGITKVAKLYYEVQTNLLTSGADYLDLYNALIQACGNLSPGVLSAADCLEVQDAANAVEMNLQPVANYNTEATTCPAGLTPSTFLFSDDMEVPNAAFTTAAITGSNRWSYFIGYAHSGVTSFIANDFPPGTSDSVLILDTGFASLPANAYLHFHHAFGFEEPNFDGGVLEYSINGGGAWNDAGTLIELHGYTGVLDSDNPLGARSAFIGDSHGYISSRVNLSALAGQDVLLRWRMGTDSSVADEGWWIDDVGLHTCPDAAFKVLLPLFTRVAAPPTGPDPGFWEADFDEFYVTSDRANVDDFATYIFVPSCGSYKITRIPLDPIVNNAFSFSGTFYASGTFGSQTTASGVDGLTNFFIGGCGTVSGGPWDWDAFWQNASAGSVFHQADLTDAAASPELADSNYRVERIK